MHPDRIRQIAELLSKLRKRELLDNFPDPELYNRRHDYLERQEQQALEQGANWSVHFGTAIDNARHLQPEEAFQFHEDATLAD